MDDQKYFPSYEKLESDNMSIQSDIIFTRCEKSSRWILAIVTNKFYDKEVLC